MSKATFNLLKISLNKPEALWLDHIHEGLEKTLKELNNGFEEAEINEANSFVRFKGEIHKIEDSQYQEVVIVTGELSARFCALCGKSGDVIPDEINIEVKSAFIDQLIIEQHKLQEEVNILIKDDEYDLFHFANKKLDIIPMLQEYIYLNKNPYPHK